VEVLLLLATYGSWDGGRPNYLLTKKRGRELNTDGRAKGARAENTGPA